MKLSKKIKYTLLSIALLCIAGIGAFYASSHVRIALAGKFPGTVCVITGKQATTTGLSWMGGGTGTTTLSCNTSEIDELSVTGIFVASSTNSTLRWHIERSMNNIDWFSEFVGVTELATTTRLSQDSKEYSFKAASTTEQNVKGGTSAEIGFGGLGTTTSQNFFIPESMIKVSTDYTRVVFYLNNVSSGTIASSSRGAVWVQGIMKESKTR